MVDFLGRCRGVLHTPTGNIKNLHYPRRMQYAPTFSTIPHFPCYCRNESSAFLKQINFNKVHPFDRVLSHLYELLFSSVKRTVTLNMPGFRSFSHLNWPAKYQSLRFSLVVLHNCPIMSGSKTNCSTGHVIMIWRCFRWLPFQTGIPTIQR